LLHDIIYSNLTSITSKVFPGIAPDKTALPYIVFFPVSNTPSPDSSGQSLLDHIRIQISCFGRSFRETEVMCSRVRRLIDELSGIYTGITVQRVSFANDVYIQEGAGVHHRVLDYMVYTTPVVSKLSKVKYARLYNWYAVDSVSGLAPDGWHVPTRVEWETLFTTLGGESIAGAKLMSARTEPFPSPRWNAPHLGTGESGFDAYGAGRRRSNPVEYINIDAYAWFWTSTSVGANYANSSQLYRQLVSTRADLQHHKRDGFSVRLLRDSLTGYNIFETITDVDGNVYDTVKIGDQVWLAQNWACTKYKNGTSIPKITDSIAWGELTTGAYCNYDNSDIYPLFTDNEIGLI
jgi:uncharacterized protein (TIGR02145 family)